MQYYTSILDIVIDSLEVTLVLQWIVLHLQYTYTLYVTMESQVIKLRIMFLSLIHFTHPSSR